VRDPDAARAGIVYYCGGGVVGGLLLSCGELGGR
jgi:hypothetical protein